MYPWDDTRKVLSVKGDVSCFFFLGGGGRRDFLCVEFEIYIRWDMRFTRARLINFDLVERIRSMRIDLYRAFGWATICSSRLWDKLVGSEWALGSVRL